MSSTDERIVKMQFDNATFKKNAADTQKQLADLNKSVDATGKSKGLLDMNSNMQKVQVTASKMSVVVTTALATITNKVVNAGINMAKALTFDPIKQGFSEYEALLTKQNVIQNATGKSAKVVKGYLNQLNTYSDKTIYSFGNMTDAIQKFVNAGVPLQTSVTSIKGIANAAAFAGASSEEANRAMYAFSQSMSLGFIQLQDWNQIENANLGTVKFKNTLLEAGVAAGTLTRKGNGFLTQSGKYVSATKGWRDGLQEQWATTKVLNTALGKYADTSTKLGKKAFEAATQVRTFSAFMDTLKESLGSGWAQVFTALIGNLGQSTRMWTGLSQSIGGVVSDVFNFLTVTLRVWRKMGGFEKTMQGFKNILAPIGALFTAIGDAWQKAFPSGSRGAGKTLYALSSGFEAVTRPLQVLADLIGYLTNPLAVFFGILHIGGVAIGDLVGYLGGLVGGLLGLADLKAPSSGGFLEFVKDIGSAIADAVEQINDLLAKGASLKEAFGSVDINLPSLPGLPSLPSLPKLPSLGSASGQAKDQESSISGMSSAVGTLTSRVSGLKSEAAGLGDSALFNPSMGDEISSIWAKMGDIFGAAWDKITEFFSKINMEDVMASFNLAVLASLSISISRFLNGLSDAFQGFAGVGPAFKDVLDSTSKSLTGFAKAAQRQAMAKMILNVAIALGILAVSLWLLSTIPAGKLATALGAMAALVLMLNVTMKQFGKVIKDLDGAKTALNTVAISIAVIALAGAMVLLAVAMLIMNKVNWTSIVKGLGTMIVTMKVLESLGNLGKDAAKNLVAGAAAIAITAGAMILLAGALLLFKLVDWEAMGKAGVSLTAVALAVGLLALIPYQGIAKVGLALALASAGMIAIANALILFGLVKWGSIAKAIVVLAALTLALLVIVALGGPASAASMLALAGSLIAVALACLIFNKVDWQSIGKATVALTVLLLAFAVGAAILTVFLYAVAPVAPVLIILAAGFFLLGLGLLAFAAAMAIAITLGAAGVAAFAALATGAAVAVAVFLQTLALQAPIMKKSFLAILQTLIDTIVEAVPMVIDGIKDLWEAIKKSIGGTDKNATFEETAASWIATLTKTILKLMPKVVNSATKIIVSFINEMAKHNAELTTAAGNWIVTLIQGLSSQRTKIIGAAVDTIIEFAQALEKNVVKLVNAGIDLIATFLHDLADAIRAGSGAIGSGLGDVASAMAEIGINMIKGLVTGIGDGHEAIDKIGDIVGKMIDIAKKIPIIHSPSRVFMEIGKFMVDGLTLGVQNNAASAISAVASMVSGQIAVANEYVDKFIQGLDQKTIAARARAAGLALAAQKAQQSADRQAKAADKAAKAANKTKKDKTDDKAAKQKQKAADKAAKQATKIEKQAEKANKIADAAAKKADAAKAAQDRKEEFDNGSYLEKAQMRSEDAQNQLDASKAAEARAEKDRQAAAVLDKQAKAKGVSPAERKALEKEADDLRKQARKEAQTANDLLAKAKDSAADALKYQALSGAEAAALFQKQFRDEAQADADAEAFDKLTDAEKAKKRREDATTLQAKAEADLAKAKKLAYTDLEAANALAQQALQEAELARQYVDDANQYEASGGGGVVIDLSPIDAAAAAFNQYTDGYDAAYAAAASTAPTVEFNQYNTSPESLNDIDIYRRTNDQIAYAADKLVSAAS